MKIFNLTVITVSLLFFSSCSASLLEKQKASDYFSEGFLNEHCFQVLVKGTPSKEERGLIDARESAFFDAKSKIRSDSESALKQYILKNACNSSGSMRKISPETLGDKKIQKEIKEIIESGTTVQEYYHSNNSAILVYRITQKKLQKRLISMGCTKEK